MRVTIQKGDSLVAVIVIHGLWIQKENGGERIPIRNGRVIPLGCEYYPSKKLLRNELELLTTQIAKDIPVRRETNGEIDGYEWCLKDLSLHRILCN